MTDVGTVIARGNVAVVTGGASGIGLAVAEQLIARGMRVALADIDDAKLRAVEARLTESGAEVLAHVCDTSSADAMGGFADGVLTRFGAAHLLFNNAGIAGVGDAWGGTLDLWDRVIGINLYGVVHGIRAFLPIMEQQGSGHIVNTASMAGLTPVPGLAPYAATKHAVVGLSESFYLEQQAAGSPIGVSVLCPGFVKTDLMDSEPTDVDAPIAQLIGAVLTDGVDNGIPATDVADRVVEAVDARQFWILTHDEMAQIPVARMQRASTQTNPTALGAAAESEAT